MKIKVKVMMTLEIDPEDYPVPADGKVEEEIQDYMQDYIHDISGIKIKHIRAVSEEI
jgi:hypothetical protein